MTNWNRIHRANEQAARRKMEKALQTKAAAHARREKLLAPESLPLMAAEAIDFVRRASLQHRGKFCHAYFNAIDGGLWLSIDYFTDDLAFTYNYDHRPLATARDGVVLM